ncbi:50S ribosomal protein L22 [Geobacter sulfurreducens]|jgi:large subunit ribosomal protein L22|uniref:Large ribosomal subunit protein uL22 n=3 Tax=Geobacter TaxID=28231 RepID=RL22_GEOSL|nr:50S ribosomal protein L22 [Geobacter sulfurreducens]Q748Z3.1 RecName: Full=Large ribosomal subunit protein uL22; AltName: Full=50S ribosomal protein L22 [Geobacter sulfurreducens PCA]AAR36245.1 ribosomal protein L22 [Geobacter sulfurreducens PCA]ADI85606.1 ribosomal protein L22 [Geobacter sulfurreducens KN400]AJY69120.1 50S ribosomal protein L22 [Geobacter sulfurreducens]QVW34668.1 50S ribosomal protein L22 [Geobacter sulfurreducens]UAC03537.1 50S ribosomal protein L22 [Geobacter sulfurred
MEASAKLTFARLSPRKTRLVVDMVRGKGIQDALTILRFSPQASAKLVSKLLRSAVANAEQKGASDVDRLYVKSISVDGGPVLKRFVPRAMGRASKIRKPTSHITVVLADKQ